MLFCGFNRSAVPTKTAAGVDIPAAEVAKNFKVWAANVTLFACKSSSACQSASSDGVMVQGVFEGLTCADGDRVGSPFSSEVA